MLIRPFASFVLLAIAGIVAAPMNSKAQSLVDPKSSGGAPITAPAQLKATYTRPTERNKLFNYVFDAFGPYPLAGAAIAAGISQIRDTPPEWKSGAAGYGWRVGSDFGIAAVSTTSRYLLAGALKQDTLYYRCECKSAFPRLGHAVVSTFTARSGDDGHRVFSFPALIAPYIGTTTAVYGWYPGRYDVKDALRMGNYSLLGYVGGNIALEFLHSGPHSLRARMHMNQGHRAPDAESP